MKNFILKIANYAFFIGLLMSLYGLWTIYKERNVDTTAVEVQLEQLTEPESGLALVNVKGGLMVLSNTYELSRSTRKTNINLSSDYYTPVVNPNSGETIYILQTNELPPLEDIITIADFTGLRQSSDALPDKIKSAFQKDLPGQNYLYLDTTYQPMTLMEKLQSNLIFFYLMLGGLTVRLILNRPSKAEPSNSEPEQAKE
ncbi:hypothetical protein L2750_06140 [Shewanella submarina]|uniref:SURF1-like protein n=1 Tax=Shewanella submarina TaxID=2016376 RepID=A0ABV7GCA0_9GAMM|nr:hypothetical protein [Shewanella submarina]MCL1036729.1 hypothetical protein [Shewanella submarina]